ncbi:MAG: TolC family protein [Deltaproteobacteria bacterium]|nr:TolC family protein [Deltaproteobacteria bacterium]
MIQARTVLVLLLSVHLDASAETAVTPKNADSPEELARQALAQNPSIRSIEHQLDSLSRRQIGVRRWHDPVLAVEYSNVPWDSWSLDDSPMSGVHLKLMQTLPFPGKNDRRAQVVHGESAVMKWKLQEKKNHLRSTVRKAYWQLALVRSLRSITKRHIELTAQLVATVEVKYRVGKVGQHELFRLQVLKTELEDDIGEFDKKEKVLLAGLNSALHRDIDTRITTSDRIDAVAPPGSLDVLLRRARQDRPLLKEILADADMQRLQAAQAEYERWPDITVWLGYRVRLPAGLDNGTDFFSAGVSIPLPFDYSGRFAAEEEQHLSLARSAEERYAATLDEIEAALSSSLAAWERATQKIATYEQTLIPEADRTLKSTLAAYQTDRADFTSLYQAQLQLLDFDRALLLAKVATRIEQAFADAAIGSHAEMESEAR